MQVYKNTFTIMRSKNFLFNPSVYKTKVKADTTSNNTKAKITFSVFLLRQLSKPFLYSVSNCSSFVLSSGSDFVLVYEKLMHEHGNLFTLKWI